VATETIIVDTTQGPVSMARTGAGSNLVMLHSLLADRNVFAPIVPALGTDHRIDLVDLPGFGATPLVGPSIDAYATVVGGLLESSEFDPSATTLIGNGLGAFVALGTAILRPDTIARLVLIGGGARFTDQGKGAFRAMIERVETGGMDSVAEVAPARIFPAAYLDEHPQAAQERRSVLRATAPEAFVNACRALLDLDYWEAAATVTQPTLLITGELDGATPPAMAMELAERMPRAEVTLIPGMGHAPQLQDPVAVLGVLQPFLARSL
jgi:3-oxoadipate enol-lactonase